MKAPELAVERATVRVSGRVLVREVDLAVGPGEVVAVVGANGAGKTTLLRLLSGDLRPSAGQVKLDGRPLPAWPPEALARRRAVLPQQPSLAFGFSALEVVLLGRTPHRSAPAHDLDVAYQAMQAAGVLPFAARSYPTLSGGEQQRVHLARALAQIWDAPADAATGSRYLLLDEPTASLDLAHQHAVLRTARRCAQAGVGVLAVLHDLNLAAQHADRIAVLRQGRLLAEGPPATVLTPNVVEQAFDVAVLVTDHPCAACPLVVPVPESLHASSFLTTSTASAA